MIAPEVEGERSAKEGRSGGVRENAVSRRRPARVEVLDVRERAAYRERLHEIESLRVEAERDHDLARASALDEEGAQIEAELSAAFGLGGRARSMADPVERARKSVYNRIRAAIKRIRQENPALGRHLESSVRTGTTCCYRPDRPTAWRFD